MERKELNCCLVLVRRWAKNAPTLTFKSSLGLSVHTKNMGPVLPADLLPEESSGNSMVLHGHLCGPLGSSTKRGPEILHAASVMGCLWDRKAEQAKCTGKCNRNQKQKITLKSGSLGSRYCISVGFQCFKRISLV